MSDFGANIFDQQPPPVPRRPERRESAEPAPADPVAGAPSPADAGAGEAPARSPRKRRSRKLEPPPPPVEAGEPTPPVRDQLDPETPAAAPRPRRRSRRKPDPADFTPASESTAMPPATEGPAAAAPAPAPSVLNVPVQDALGEDQREGAVELPPPPPVRPEADRPRAQRPRFDSPHHAFVPPPTRPTRDLAPQRTQERPPTGFTPPPRRRRVGVLLDLLALQEEARQRGAELSFRKLLGGIAGDASVHTAICYLPDGAPEILSGAIKAIGFRTTVAEHRDAIPARMEQDADAFGRDVDALILAPGGEDQCRLAGRLRDRGLTVEVATFLPEAVRNLGQGPALRLLGRECVFVP